MLRFFFTETEKLAENVQFFLNGEKVEPVKRGQYLTLDASEITVEKFATINTVSVTDGVSIWTLEYSVLSYAQRAVEQNEDASKKKTK